MRYEILGEFRVSGPAGVRAPRAAKIETLLAVLLSRANQVITTDQLVAELWSAERPHRANAALYVYLSELRKLLRGDAARPATRAADGPLTRNARGYCLTVHPGELDATAFTRQYERGQELHARRNYRAAATALREAAQLWRGDVFGGHIDAPSVLNYASQLDEARLECLELLMETELLIGRHREVIGQLSQLTREHTLRETFYQYHMIALTRANRRAEALRTYAVARHQLGRQLGVEPGQVLQQLYLNLLTNDMCDAV